MSTDQLASSSSSSQRNKSSEPNADYANTSIASGDAEQPAGVASPAGSRRAGHIPTFGGFFRQNLDAMVRLLAKGDKKPAGKSIGFELERILISPDGVAIPFSGDKSVSALLAELAKKRTEDELVFIDGRLFGFSYTVDAAGEAVDVNISLEPAAQLEISVGPAHSVRALYQAVEGFDADVNEALAAIGLAGTKLTGIGYDPTVSSPLDLELIPKERYHDMDAYLSKRGRYARDMMRCTASTQVSLDYENEDDAKRIIRMATILGPYLAFLFDNAPVFRGKPTPGMARSRIWHHVDVDRCGINPGALDGLSFEDYVLWVSNVKPILFTDAQHVTTSTGDRYERDVMSERPLEKSELFHLLSMVFPNVRLKGFCELREMDSLPPRLAAACTSFTGALFYDRCLEAKLAERLAEWLPNGFADVDDFDCVAARLHLEEQGWDAETYGVPADAFTKALVDIARENVADGRGCTGVGAEAPASDVVPVVRDSDAAVNAFDLEGIDMLAAMWEKRELPRNVLEY